MATLQKIQLITCADRAVENTLLWETAMKFGWDLEVLRTKGPWISHMSKFKLIYEYVLKKNPTDLILYVDAFDVAILKSPDDLLTSYIKLGKGLIFSAETNYQNEYKPLRKAIKQHHPTTASRYPYLNAGTFIGLAKEILRFYESIKLHYTIDLDDTEQLHSFVCDQSLTQRFLVEKYSLQNKEWPVKLDYNQEIFACTGGLNLPSRFRPKSRVVSFHYYKKLNRYLKKKNLKKFQVYVSDYEMNNGQMLNRHTGSYPSVLHCPGMSTKIKCIYYAIIEGSYPTKRYPVTIQIPFWSFISLMEALWLTIAHKLVK